MDSGSEARGAYTVNGLLRDAAQAYGDRPCIRYRQGGEIREHSYRDLFRDSLRLCGRLQKQFPPQTHIALIGKTAYRYLVCLNAIMMSDCIAVPLAVNAPPEETVRLLTDSDAYAVFYDGTLRDAQEIFDACPLLRYREDLNEPSGSFPSAGKTTVSRRVSGPSRGGSSPCARRRRPRVRNRRRRRFRQWR